MTALPEPGPEQLLVVTTDSWGATRGRAMLFEGGRRVWGPHPVYVGWAGLGWGRGEHRRRTTPPRAGPVKREGDGRSPAGAFRIGPRWTRAWGRLSYCVDDTRSAHYGRVVTVAPGAARPWRSAEEMESYRVAIEVTHNPERVPGAGSCIFLHDGEEPTVGCTAMKPAALDDLTGRLRLGARLVQLPADVYRRVAVAWKLPPLAE